MLDMNGLKAINDNNGHEDGDNAIKSIAYAIETSTLRDMSSYRMGGDEFVVLALTSKEDELKKASIKIKSLVEEKGYSVSSGVAYREDKEDLASMIKRAEIDPWPQAERARRSAGR